MPRATRCLFALGLSVSLAAACGDDDGDGTNTGGTGGGGTGGSAGTAGRGGTAGTAGAAGTGGSAGGVAGAAGDNGGGGDGAGAAGAPPAGGTGGDDDGDAGTVPDAPIPLLDAGGSCPASLAEPPPAAATASASSDNVEQEVLISLISFEGDDIRVRFRGNPNGLGFNFAEPLVLCTGSQQINCDSGVAELEGSGTVDGGTGILLPGEEIEYVFENALNDDTETTAEAGELALVNNLVPSELLFPENAFVRAYVNWGGYVSLEPEGEFDAGTIFDNLEVRAVDGGVWEGGESVEIGTNTAIFATGDVKSADGFETCTAD